jgi:glycosyltransferase involved in cell wall biosynthesis
VSGVTTPKVSVCIPTYRYARYLPEAIDSVLAQQFADFELLIIDDHSPDDSRAIIEGYARNDNRIVWSVNGRNIGMVANWNRCLEEARGEYVRFLFGDDFLTSPESLSQLIGLLDDHPAAVLAGSARLVVDEDSRTKRTVSRFPDGSHLSGRGVVRRCLLEERNLVGEPSAVMFRRRAAARGFDPSYRQLVDLEMWFHLLAQGGYCHAETPLVAFREHGTQQSVHNERAGVLIEEMVRINVDYGRRLEDASPFWAWLLECQMGYRCLQWQRPDRAADAAAVRDICGRFGIEELGLTQRFLYRLVKPLVRMWLRGIPGRIR